MRFPYFALLLATLSPLASAVPPVVDDPLVEGTEQTVQPRIPTGKALLLPISTYSTEGGQLTITATSSKPHVMVRVKTGNPLLRFEIEHQGANETDPPYTRTAVFQLFRDIAPETVSYMAGFAQAGFFSKPEVLNDQGVATTGHNRIFRLYDGFGTDAGQARDSFIFQGGASTGTTKATAGFRYDNEFHPSAIFNGRGQLAMANSGYDNLKRGSNGTSFFLTDGTVRKLDFQHTIWGQMTHGWRVLEDLRNTPRQTTPTTGTDSGLPDYPRQDQPNRPIRITSSTIIPQYVEGDKTYTDAVLVLSATAPGPADITITARNAAGEQTARTFTVTAQDEPVELNSRPFITPLPNAIVPVRGQANLRFNVIDLERDYVTLSQALQSNVQNGQTRGISGLVASNVLGVIGNPNFAGGTGTNASSYTGPLYPTVTGVQFDMKDEAANLDNSTAAVVGVGEKAIQAEDVVIYGSPGVSLPTIPVPVSATSTEQQVLVGRFRDTDARALPGDVSVQINWGDGTALQTGVVTPDRTKPSATSYQITGKHVYDKPGIYPVVSQLIGTKGLYQKIRSTAVVTASPLKAVGDVLSLPGPTIPNATLATFKDEASPAAPAAYVATVDWGDGVVTTGTVKAAGLGQYKVLGKHSYRDSQQYALTVRIHKAGTPAEQDGIAWTTIATRKAFGKRYLPPFDQVHLVGGISAIPVDERVPSGPKKESKQTVVKVAGTATTPPVTQTYLTYKIQVINSGNRPSKPGKLRFYLSRDRELNKAAIKDSADAVITPADIPLKMKDLNTSEFMLQGIPAGGSLQYFFEKSQYADYRLVPPLNETGTGFYVLIELVYSDALAEHQPIDRVAAEGVINGIFISPKLLQTRESGTTATFQVTLDKQPVTNVVIPLAVEATGEKEATLDKATLTFTPENWRTPQVVTVKGIRDTPTSAGTTPASVERDGSKQFKVLLNAVTGDDPFYAKMDGPDVIVVNADRDSNISLGATAVSISEVGAQNERTVNLQLQREPTHPVTITAAVSDSSEAEITTGQPATDDTNKRIFTFLPRDPTATPPIQLLQQIKIRGKEDNTRDGNQTFAVTFTVNSEDPEFDDLILLPIAGTAVDNGTAPAPAP